jgi:hypothetical protein
MTNTIERIELKVNKEKENVQVIGYMRRGFDDYEGRRIEVDGMNFFLINVGGRAGWGISEEKTKRWFVTFSGTKKQDVLNKLEELLISHKDKMLSYIEKHTLEAN